MQLTKDEIKELMGTYKVKITGLTITSDNRLLINKNDLGERKSLLGRINITPDNLYYTVKEAERYITDTLIAGGKYKGFSMISDTKGIGLYFNNILNYIALEVSIGVNKSIDEIKAINYMQEYYELIPKYFQDNQRFNSNDVQCGNGTDGNKRYSIIWYKLPVKYTGADVITRRQVEEILSYI